MPLVVGGRYTVAPSTEVTVSVIASRLTCTPVSIHKEVRVTAWPRVMVTSSDVPTALISDLDNSDRGRAARVGSQDVRGAASGVGADPELERPGVHAGGEARALPGRVAGAGAALVGAGRVVDHLPLTDPCAGVGRSRPEDRPD